MSERAAELRLEFDTSFQHQPQLLRVQRQEILIIKVGAQSYGLRLEQVRGIFKDKNVTPLPGSPPALLGITGIRGHLVSVYDLAAWLGQTAQSPRWLALVEAGPGVPLALAFDALQGQTSFAPSDFVPGGGIEQVEGFLQRESTELLPVLQLNSLAKNSERAVE